MNKHAKWSMALLAMVGLAFLVGSWSPSSQDKGKKTEIQQEKEKMQKEAAMKAHAKQMAAFKKAFPTLKTSLVEAIALAEKETKGRAHSGDVELGKDGKLTIEVGLLVGDEFREARVDPETKKVSLVEDDEDDEHAEGDEHEEGHEHGEGDEDEDDD